MKRKLFIAGATFVLVAAAVTAIAANRQTNTPSLMEANIEALESRGVGGGGEGGEGGSALCASGGRGASQCSNDGNIAGSGGGCSVTCNSGYYACCNVVNCYCVRN